MVEDAVVEEATRWQTSVVLLLWSVVLPKATSTLLLSRQQVRGRSNSANILDVHRSTMTSLLSLSISILVLEEEKVITKIHSLDTTEEEDFFFRKRWEAPVRGKFCHNPKQLLACHLIKKFLSGRVILLKANLRR